MNAQAQEEVNVVERVKNARKQVRTDSLGMSFGEMAGLYSDGVLDVNPKFQRFFRWDDHQKSNFIESVLLGIPIPPIFVSQRDDAVWEVVDGLQRLSTVFQFMNILKDAKGKLVDPLLLSRTRHLPFLEGKGWKSDDSPTALDNYLRLMIRTSKIDLCILLMESDEKTKFEIFHRLNTGGTPLSAQEVRNCSLVMTNQDFFDWLEELKQYRNFQDSISLSDKSMREAYDTELVLRFLVFSQADEEEISKMGDMGDFLTDYALDFAKNDHFEMEDWRERFEATFDLLAQSLDENAFRRYDFRKKRHQGGFIVSQFEAVSFGVSWNLERDTLRDDFADAIRKLWSNREFNKLRSPGTNAATRIRGVVPFARGYFSKG